MIYLSVIVPIRNEEKYIADTLESMIKQKYDKERYELLVIDGMSDDGTRSVVNHFIEAHADVNIRLLENPGRLSSCARNIGALESRGEFVAVIDGHVFIPNDKLFEKIEYHATKNKAKCLARPAPLVVPGISEGNAYWIAISRKTWMGHSSNSLIYSDYEGFVDPVSSGFAYHKSIFDIVGLFDESFDAAEDVEFHHRVKKAGIEAYTSPELLIYSYPRDTLKSLFKQQVRYGIGRARFVRKHFDGMTKETLIPSIILLMVGLYPLGYLFGEVLPHLFVLWTIAILVYLAPIFITGIYEASRRGKTIKSLFISCAIAIIHFGLGWGFIKTIFKKKTELFNEKRLDLTSN